MPSAMVAGRSGWLRLCLSTSTVSSRSTTPSAIRSATNCSRLWRERSPILSGKMIRSRALGGMNLSLSWRRSPVPSMWLSIYPDDGDDVETLLKHADVAMYRAKEKGRNNYQFFAADMNTRAFERLAMENKLRRALERNEF